MLLWRGRIRTNVLTCRRQSNQLISSHLKAVCSPASDFEDGQRLRKPLWMRLIQLQIHMLQIKHSLKNKSGVTQMNTWTARHHLKKKKKKKVTCRNWDVIIQIKWNILLEFKVKHVKMLLAVTNASPWSAAAWLVPHLHVASDKSLCQMSKCKFEEYIC